MSWFPNTITALRIGATPVVVWLLAAAHYRSALAVLIFAGLTDFLDGFSARRLHVTSSSGLILDPLADKIMLVAVYVTLVFVGLVPLWLFLLVVARDLMIVIGAGLLRWLRNRRKFLPSPLGKVSTFFQILFCALVLLNAAFPGTGARWILDIGLWLAAAFTLISALDYIRRGIAMAREPVAIS